MTPADADDMVRTMIGRVVRRTCDSNGEIRFGPLPPGDYEVCRALLRWRPATRSRVG